MVQPLYVFSYFCPTALKIHIPGYWHGDCTIYGCFVTGFGFDHHSLKFSIGLFKKTLPDKP
jgi:hypothetical protein